MREKDTLEKDGLKIIKIMVQCKCGNVWGINIQEYESLKDIPLNRLVCNRCERINHISLEKE